MHYGGKTWTPLTRQAMNKMDDALKKMGKEFEDAGGVFKWEPHNIKYDAAGNRILGSFDNTVKGQPVITIYQGGNRGTMAHELFHSRQYGLHGRLGDGTVLGGVNQRVRDAMELDVYNWLRSMGWGPKDATDIMR